MTSTTRRRAPFRRAIWHFVVPLAALCGTAFFAYIWGADLMDSLADYHSPIRDELPAGQPLSPLTDNLVLVMIDGLRHDTATQMTFLNELAAEGAELVVVGDAPSYSQNAWTTLITGASPQISAAPPLNVDDITQIAPISAGDLFVSATNAGLSTGLYGYYWWGKMVPAEFRGDSAFTEGEDADADQDILDAALATLDTDMPDFALIHLDQVDYAGHQHGGRSEQYDEAALRVDAHLEEIVSRLNLNRQTVVVLADHGHINRGGHGGQDSVVLTTRLVAVGAGIRPGEHGQIRQVDVAPTLAALMGVSIPPRSQGQFADDMLAWEPDARAGAWYELATRRRALTAALLQGIGSPVRLEDADTQIGAIEEQLSQQAWDKAGRIAATALDTLENHARGAYSERVARERLERVWMPAAYLLGLGVVVWRNQRRGRRLPWLPALAAIAAYHLLFLAGGNRYSLSTVTGLSPFLTGIVFRTLAGLTIGWLWIMLTRRQTLSRSRTVEQALGYGWLVIAMLVIPVLAITWWIGPTIGWMLPDFRAQFVLFTTLLQIVFVSAGAALLAGLSAVWPALGQAKIMSQER